MRGRAMLETDLAIVVGRKLDYQMGYGSPAVMPQAKFIRMADHADELRDNRRGEVEVLAVGQLDIEAHRHHAQEGHCGIGFNADLLGREGADARITNRLFVEIGNAQQTTLEAEGHGVGDAELRVDHASRFAIEAPSHHVHCLLADTHADVLHVLGPQAAAMQLERQIAGRMREAAGRVGLQAQVIHQRARGQAGLDGVELELAVLVQVDEA